MAAGVPVVTFNTDAPDSRRLFYVGNNSRQSGLMGAQLLSTFLQGRGNVTILGNFSRATPFIERFGGFCEYVQLEAPDIHIYPCSECRSLPDLAAQSLTDLLERVPDINGVFCTGYSSTAGALQAVKALGRRDIQVVGYDLTEKTAAALREGWCAALLYQNPYRQGPRPPGCWCGIFWRVDAPVPGCMWTPASSSKPTWTATWTPSMSGCNPTGAIKQSKEGRQPRA